MALLRNIFKAFDQNLNEKLNNFSDIENEIDENYKSLPFSFADADYEMSTSCVINENINLIVEKLYSFEHISEPYLIYIRAYIKNKNINFPDILNKRIVVNFFSKMDDKIKKIFTGIITEVEEIETVFGIEKNELITFYKFIVRPKIWLLEHSGGSKIFKGNNLVKIIDDIFKQKIGGADVSAVQKESFQIDEEKYKYHVQYDESDFNFVSRLMEEAGIFYYFKISQTDEKIVLGSNNNHFLNSSPLLEIKFTDNQDHYKMNVPISFSYSQKIRKTKYKITDFNHFENGVINAEKNNSNNIISLDFTEYPGNYEKVSSGTKIAEIRLQAENVDEKIGILETTIPGIQSGQKIKISGHASKNLNGEYIVIMAEHWINSFISDEENEIKTVYYNRLTLIPYSSQFKPQQKTKRGNICGLQTATVVADGTAEIKKDTHASVFVKFHWDQNNVSIPIRVSHDWAGKDWGFAFIPRKDMEVIVAFLRGDPDRPVILGSLYNYKNNFITESDKKPEISMIRSRSSLYTPYSYNKLKKYGIGPLDSLYDLTFDAINLAATLDLNKLIMIPQKIPSPTAGMYLGFQAPLSLSSIIKSVKQHAKEFRCNEIRLDDEPNKELLYLKAQNDFLRHVLDGHEIDIIYSGSKYTILWGVGVINYLFINSGQSLEHILSGRKQLHIGKGDWDVYVNGDINITATGNINMLAGKGVNITALTQNVNVTAKAQNINMEALLNINGTALIQNINFKSKLKDITFEASQNIDGKAITKNINFTALAGDVNLTSLKSNINITAYMNINESALTNVNVSAKLAINLTSLKDITMKSAIKLTIISKDCLYTFGGTLTGTTTGMSNITFLGITNMIHNNVVNINSKLLNWNISAAGNIISKGTLLVKGILTKVGGP